MKKELSILIPIYNYPCYQLASRLSEQAERLEGLAYELILAEDGSDDASALEANSRMADLPHCRYIRRQENIGRAAIRNWLVGESRYQWLLFLDCDMELSSDRFVQQYLACEEGEVVCGGFGVKEQPDLLGRNLRYSYEWTMQPHFTAEERRRRPYQHFRTTNFMASREVMLSHPFDERFHHYGYEDVLFGKALSAGRVPIAHIDNELLLTDNEANAVFVSKTEESLQTLYAFRKELKGYSRLLTFVDGIHLGIVRWTIRLWHRLAGPLERRNLCGSRPRLKLFKLYKLGYYLSLTKN